MCFRLLVTTILTLMSAVSCSAGHARLSPPATSLPRAPLAPAAFGPKEIDALLASEWRARGIVPAPAVDDARFLRRAYLDVLGTLPPPHSIAAFVADRAADKRARLVAQLVELPAYADHWTNYWDDELMGKSPRDQDVDRAAFRRWLRARFAENAPWNKVVYELVTATGQNSAGGPRRPRLDDPMSAETSEDAQPGTVNGAVNWILQYEKTPQDLAGSASRTFMGVQIQCAQCHDHKTEKWKQDDFRRFAACFARARAKPLEAKQMGGIRRVELQDLPRALPRLTKDPELAPIAAARPTALDGTDLSASGDVRQALGAWVTSRDNPWFARAIVNRMWAHYLGRGFVDPIDDMRPSNKPAMDALLAKLADDFVSHGYDLKQLTRTITSTAAYQLASSGGEPDADNHFWARFRLVPMGPEELLNALYAATNVEGTAKRAGVANLDQLRMQLVSQYTFLFDVDEAADRTTFEGTVSQALLLLNGTLVGVGSAAIPGSALSEVLASPGSDAQKIEALYLRTLSRQPTAEEVLAGSSYVSSAVARPLATILPPLPRVGTRTGGKRDPLRRIEARAAHTVDPRKIAYEDIFWALLNSSEFLFNH